MIEIADIRKNYRMGTTDVHVLRGVSLHIRRSEFIAIVGPSGSGKSTLMHILGLLDSPTSGTYRLDGRDISSLNQHDLARLRARTIGFVFQQFNLLPRISALENVALPLIYSNNQQSASPTALLTQVGLGSRLKHAPNELSGGEQQRVAIARSLVNRPAIIMADEPTGNLDSASSADIMRLLRDLHETGLTVILVTHDPEVAHNADRIITIRDGCIVEDTGNRHSRPAPPAPTGSSAQGIGLAVRTGRKIVEVLLLVKQACRALAANKARTFLSMLGVLIGVGAVIAMMALGAGAKQAVEERISSMGANLLILMPGSSQSRGVALGAGAVSRLTLDDADAIRASIDAVAESAPIVRGSAQVTFENRNWRTGIVGTTPSYATMHEMIPPFGRFFSNDDILTRAKVAVIGLTVSRELFGDVSPLGRNIRINRLAFEVIGVLPQKGASFHMDENDQILIPITTAMRRLMGKDYVERIEMQIDSAANLDYAELAAIDLVMKRHRVNPSNDQAFQTRNMAEIQNAIAATSNTMAALLAGIGAISLLVGGIGIMNIMLVSVTERTREIGIRKAVGARGADILAQFLVESLVISVLGGIIGIALGIGSAIAMSRLAGWTVAVTAQTVSVSFAFAAGVGIVFGIWPARKAAALEPIEALRYE